MAAAALEDDPPIAVANYGAGALPTDVLYCILLRLPADEVRRLRLVCRSWRSLTSDPHFARAHLSRHPQVVALHDNRHVVHVVDLISGGKVLKRVHLVQKSLGLSTQHDALCVSQVLGQAYVLDLAAGTAMANITAKQETSEWRTSTTPTTMIGRVPSTGEYKLLRVRSYLSGTPSQTCQTMTLSEGCDGTWRNRPCPPLPIIHSSMALVAGVVYFLVNAARVEPDSITSFDLAKEEWRPTTLQGPLTSLRASTKTNFMCSVSRSQFQLSVLSDCLVTVHCNYNNSSADIWFLVDMDKPVWSKKYAMRCEPFGMYPRHYRPLAVLDDGRVAVLVEGARIVRAYDPRTSLWTDMARLKDYCSITMYHGSFLCSGAHG
ncbi:hypothetical protein EJB05_00177, partial [Eragrostis curvula]